MTLRHIVSWKFSGETKEQRDAQAAGAIEVLAPLPEKISSVRAFSLHRNELFDGANFDLMLIADFDDEAGLEFYAKHPDHQPALQYMPTVAAARSAMDFTV